MRTIELVNTIEHEVEEVSQLALEFMKKFTQLVIFAQPGALDLCAKAINLTVLDLAVPAELSFLQLARRLEPLKKLRQLWLVLDFDRHRPPLSEFDSLSTD